MRGTSTRAALAAVKRAAAGEGTGQGAGALLSTALPGRDGGWAAEAVAAAVACGKNTPQRVASMTQHVRGVAPVASLGSMTVGLCVHCCVLDVSSPPRSLRTRVPRLVQLPGRRWDRPLRAEPEELGVDDPCAKFSPKCASRPGTSGPRTRRPRATGSPSTWASPGKRPKATKTRPHFIWRIERRNARERNGLSARVYHAVGL